jgi:hypothetical protein
MGSGAMICMQSFIKTGWGIQKLMGVGNTYTQTARWAHKPTFIFQNKENTIKN